MGEILPANGWEQTKSDSCCHIDGLFFPFSENTCALALFHVRGGLEERKLISWDFNGLRLTSARTNGKIPKTGIFPINTKLPNILMTVAVAVAVVGPLHQDHMRRSQHGNSNTS